MASDYHLSPETVYTQAVKEMIREQGNLQTLSACVHPSERMVKPTWVPRLQPARYQPHPEPTLRERRTLHTHRPKDGGPAKLDAQGTRRGAVSRASGRGTRLSEKFQILALDAPVTPWQRRTRPSPQSTRGSMADSVHGHATRQPIRPRSLRLTCLGRVCRPIPHIHAPRRPVRS